MAVLCRWILVLTLLLAAGPRLRAASAADRAFDAAVKAFQDAFYARAEAQLADFCQKYPASPRLAEVILLRAQAQLELTNYTGAIELLTANQGRAGTNADQYLFWLAEACARKGDWRAASDGFAKLVKEFPASSRCLEASLGEAAARAALAQTEPAEWPRVIELLQRTNGLFQCAARTNAASEFVPRGYLLLSEAQLAAKDFRAAEETLQPLAKRFLNPRLAWQWQYLLCRIEWADGRTNAALRSTTNLLAAAANSAQTNLLAESTAFQADLLERLGQTNEALVAYQRNLAEGVPAERQRQALLKITELSLAQHNIPQATQMLEKFWAQYPKAASADLALLTLGELRLRQYEPGAGTNQVALAVTNAPAATNGLQLALDPFNTLVKEFPQSPLFGKAQLDLGWCYRRDGRLSEAQAAFQAAVERLPSSEDLATAYFRLADTQFQQTNFAGAIKNCQAIIEKFGALQEVKTNLFEPALYLTVRAGLAGGELATATNAMQNLQAWYPGSLSTARAVLLTGQEIRRRGDPAAARKLLLDFDKAVPDAPLRAERQLAVAATWEQENKWAEAIAQYDAWLAGYTNHEAKPRAEYYRAWDTSQAGRDTNALILFTNIVARFPTNEFARLAQIWVADYYYRIGESVVAETNYLALVQNTNWPADELTYQAQLMAGRSAVARQGWKDARAYFTQLYNNTNCPTDLPLQVFTDLRLQALFEFGDTLTLVVDPTQTNKLANWEEAVRVFGRICEEYPTNRLAVRAWGRRGDCNLQWALARQQYDSLTNALNAYQQVVDSPQADVALRSQAKVGLAVTLEKWAEQKTGKERTTLLDQALSNCVDVVYGTILLHDDEQPDPFWTKEAGMKGLELADSLQAWSQEVRLYQRLTNSVWPQLPAALVKRAAKARETLERGKAIR
jgi:TolA-binding protein